MATIAADIEQVIRRFLKALEPRARVRGAYLFGSQVKGTASEWSDIDLAVVSPDFSGDLISERLLLMKLAIQSDNRIEPRPFRPEDFDAADPLVDEILRTGIPVN